MELRSDVTGTRPVAQTSAVQQVSPAGDFKQDVYARLMALAVGRPVGAEVVSQAEDGTSMVRVADTVVQMELPQDAKVGDKVTLTLLAREPRLTFLFEREPAAHSMLSNTGRLIDNILRSVPQNAPPATLAGRAPLLPAPADSATALLMPSGLAASLQTALSNLFTTSGLFYESHLAQWVAGNRPQAELMAEPQAKMHNPARNLAGNEGMVREQDQMNRLESLQEKSWVQSLMSKVAAKMPVLTQQQPEKTESVVDRDAANMIRMQLDTLEHRKVVWQGELWPGQEMEWEIEDDTSRRKKEYGESAQPGWQSVLRVNLPLLGSITATMRLSGEAVQLQLGASDETAISVLREFGPELVSAFETTGARLDYFMVNDEAA